MINNQLTMLAVRYLTYQLRKDKSFWMAYQANIAMAIYDNYNKYMPLTTGKSSPTLHEFCNQSKNRLEQVQNSYCRTGGRN